MNIKSIYEELNSYRNHWETEEEVRKDWLRIIENNLSINFHAERKRNDASYNQIIIEFKNKGMFKSVENSPKYKEAIYDRLKPYILEKAKHEGISESEYTGIATDGDHIVFCYIENGDIYPQSLMPFSESSFEKVLLAISENKRRALIEENLIEDFGHNSQIAIDLMSALSNELEIHYRTKENNKIKMLFEEWKSLFGQISNLSAAKIKHIQKAINFKIPEIGDNSIPGTLFIIHTYNALFLKLLGAELLSHFNNLTQYKDFCEYIATQEDSNLMHLLYIDIERSNFFSKAGVKGFVEEVLFSWYLDASEESNKTSIIKALRQLMIKLSLYRMDNLDSARSRDILKRLYQSLIPDTLRKSLGEFYTPDWLIEITTQKARIKNWLEIKSLDPTCGSGSFLINIVRKKIELARKQNWDSESILDHILNNVWGFDLNPLAVQSARVNFLIAISELLQECKGKKIELPILLADCVYSPARNPDYDEEVVEYQIGSSFANLLIRLPSELAFDRIKLDKIFTIMEEEVDNNSEYYIVADELFERKILTEKELLFWKDHLEFTYNKVLDLHLRNWNGIWFRIVRNFFWSATAGHFDLVIGNPPWVRWSNLPEEYRSRIKPTCEKYEIFSDTPYHGGNELDISGMITYTVADKWLKENGKLCFVLTQTHFQSPSSQGFRSFIINDEYSLVPKEIHDFKNLKPFPEAANKTSIALFKKSSIQKIKYPIKYFIWNTNDEYSKVIPENLKISNINKRFKITEKEANPVDNERSPWAIMDINKFNETIKIRGKSDWIQGRKGVTTDLNAIYMVELKDVDEKRNLYKIKTHPELGRNTIHLKSKEYWIEPDLIYPMVKGASDFEQCYFSLKNIFYIIVPNKGIVKEKLIEAQREMKSKYYETFEYFKDYKDLLSNRSTYKARLSRYDFYMVYNIGDYTFAPYKVIWAEQSGKFEAAVIHGKEIPILGYRPYIPDHKIYFADFYDEDIAYFVCALLNAPIVREYIESHTISIQVSNIFKHLKLPKLDKELKSHLYIISLSKLIHSIRDKSERVKKLTELYSIAGKILLENGT